MQIQSLHNTKLSNDLGYIKGSIFVRYNTDVSSLPSCLITRRIKTTDNMACLFKKVFCVLKRLICLLILLFVVLLSQY